MHAWLLGRTRGRPSPRARTRAKRAAAFFEGQKGQWAGLSLSALSRPVAWSGRAYRAKFEPTGSAGAAPPFFSHLSHTQSAPTADKGTPRTPQQLSRCAFLPSLLRSLASFPLPEKKQLLLWSRAQKNAVTHTRVFFGSYFFILLHLHATTAIALLPRSLEARQSLSCLGALRRGGGSRGG